MQRYALSHLSDQALLRDLAALVARDRGITADLLAHIAEVDARKLYVPAAYPSMFAYCVGELRLSEDAAAMRIQAARVARRFPAILAALAEGRLHLSAVVLLSPHLAEDTADELLTAATHRSKSEIERLLAARFPRADMLAWVEGMPASSSDRPLGEHAPGHVENEHALAHVEAQRAPGPVERSRVKPLSSESFSVQFTMSRSAYDKLRYAQERLSHQVPSGDIAGVVERALDAFIPQLEKCKFGATERPGTRHIPAHVRRTVWARDGGRCTFVSEAGRRCEARKLLEFDHVQELARGGEATVAGIRLRCRAHNQYGAECTFGAEFMRHKRAVAAQARVAARGCAEVPHVRAAANARTAAARDSAADPDRAHLETGDRDVVPWLRQLGFSATEARCAAARCEDIPHASLEERVRVALSSMPMRGFRTGRPLRRLEMTASFAGAATGRAG